MSSDKPSGRSVFVGNIPYGLTEEQVVHIFGQVGTVVNFRLVFDRETGRPKGYGFAEYQDADSAASAVRNLNDFEILNRKLRVNFPNDGANDDAAPPGYVPQPPLPTNGMGLPPPPPQQSMNLPPLPPGVDVPPGLTCPDAISRTLSTLPPAQLLDILSQMKGLVMADPSKAGELLKQAPQLSYAVFQALLLMGLVDASALQSVIEQTPGVPVPPQVVAAPAPSIPLPPQLSYPQGYGQMPVPTPPGRTPYAPPPVPTPQPPQAAPAAAPSIAPDQAALLQQVLALPMEQINAMPPAERDQLLTLRQQIISGAIRL
ncbi:MAG: hypothetical protein M1817_002123 [Caeruleum heppii]|nr:MAG: hypothetical protein M1817_002123 [Caeruleum heppii]